MVILRLGLCCIIATLRARSLGHCHAECGLLMYGPDLLGTYSHRAVQRSIWKYARKTRLGPTSRCNDAATWPQMSAFLQQSVPFDQITVFAIGGTPELSGWAANRVTTQQAICRVLGFC